MNPVEVVLANNDRVTLRVGDMFLKVDADAARLEREAEAIATAPVPTPEIRWRKPSMLALGAVRGRTLGRLGTESTAGAAAWAAVGATIGALHDAPLPARSSRSIEDRFALLDDDCTWLVDNDVLPQEIVERNRSSAEQLRRPYAPVFVHGDLHLEHVFVENGTVTGIIDWSEAGQGDPLVDIASITLANDAHLDDVLAGYGGHVDRDLVRAWWSLRCLGAVRWLFENGYGDPDTFPEVVVLRSLG